MRNNEPKSIILLSLITVILSAGVFKEEMQTIHLWSGSWDLLTVFIIFALFYGFLLAVYLLIELSPDTPGFKFLQKYSKQVTPILNLLLSISISLVVVFSVISLLMNILAISGVIEVMTYVIAYGLSAVFVLKPAVGLGYEINGLVKDIKHGRKSK